MARFDLVGCGSMVLDTIVRVPVLQADDAKLRLPPATAGEAAIAQRPGGVTLDHLGWARCLGLEVGIVGCQAEDEAGRALRAAMDRLGIVHAIDRSGAVSSRAVVLSAADGRRAIYMAPGATARLSPDGLDAGQRDMLRSARFVSTEVSQLPLATALAVVEHGRAGGARTLLDLDVPADEALPGLGTPDELEALLHCCDIVKLSPATARGLVDAVDPEAIARELADRFACSHVAVTLGEEGALLLAQGALHRQCAAPVALRDATGAGDAFVGGLLAGLARGDDGAAVLALACAAGAACCAQLGAFPEDPARARADTAAACVALGGAPLRGPGEDAPGAPTAGADFLSRIGPLLEEAADGVDRNALARAVALILAAQQRGARVHTTGVGKPEHLARYGAALLSSTGTPAYFLHATEALHGSLGQLCAGDVVLAISNSGATEEVLAAARAARDAGAQLLALTGDTNAPLAQLAEVALVVSVPSEGDALGLAPRASFLAAGAALCALSVGLQQARDFSAEDFRSRHPGGALGRDSRDDATR